MKGQALRTVSLAAALLMASTSPATATTASITPASQTHTHGVASHWTVSWTGKSPYTWSFDFGDGFYTYGNGVTYTSRQIGYTFWPCSTTRFQQSLVVDDANGIRGVSSGYATEAGGSPC